MFGRNSPVKPPGSEFFFLGRVLITESISLLVIENLFRFLFLFESVLINCFSSSLPLSSK